MNKTIRLVALTIVLLFALSCFGYIVLLASKNSSILGPTAKPILEFAQFPGTFMSVLKSKEVNRVSPTFISIEDGTSHQDETINKLTYDLYGLISYYEVADNRWHIDLFNFRTDSLVHQWHYEASNYLEDEVFEFERAQLKNSLLCKDKSVIVSPRETRNLTKLNANSEVVWRNTDFLFHHAMNFDSDSSIWICASKHSQQRKHGKPLNTVIKDVDGKVLTYRDDLIVKVDKKSGETLYTKSLSKIFMENDLPGLLASVHADVDPIHLNDIEPALSDSEHWKKNDLFISMRSKSIIIHYRPSTNEVLKVFQGPFAHQHDVDFFSDHELSIFDNNWYDIGIPLEASVEGKASDWTRHSSEIIIYDYETDNYRSYYQAILKENNFYTPTGGVHSVLSNGDLFLDLEDVGRLVVVDEDEVKYRKIFPASVEGYKHVTNWTRVFEELHFEEDKNKRELRQ